MSRFIPRGAFALPALLIALGTSTAVALPAQAAGGFRQNADFSITVQACTSVDGQTWSAPVTLAHGVSPAVAIAPDGRAVAVWEGGAGTVQATVQASVRPPGGQWSTVVTLSTDAYGHPVIGIDGSGNAIAAWAGGSGAIDTASLPAGGKWTRVNTLAPTGQAVGLAVNPAGAAIITWATRTANMAATRTAGGTWSTPAQLSAHPDGPVDVAIDGAGDALAVFKQFD